MRPRTFLYFFISILTSALILASCTLSHDKIEQTRKQSYIDTNLFFSISYPEAWASSLVPIDQAHYHSYADNSVVWNVQKDFHSDGRLMLAVISIPENGFIPAAEMMQVVLTDLYPNFTISSIETSNLSDGPAIMSHGYTPRQTFRTWLVTGAERHYLIICASSSEKFSRYLRIFEEIAQSFQILR